MADTPLLAGPHDEPKRVVIVNATTGDPAGESTGTNPVAGDVAAAATDSGNPVKMGAVFVTTPPTYLTTQRVNVQANARGILYSALSVDGATVVGIAGSAVSDGTAAGNGLYVAGLNRVFNGTNWDRLRDILGAVAAGTGNLAVEQAGSAFNNITTNTTTTVKSGAGTLHRIVVNNPGTTATLTLYDSLTASGTKIGTIAVGSAPGTIAYEAFFSTGLTIVSTGAPDITAVYR